MKEANLEDFFIASQMEKQAWTCTLGFQALSALCVEIIYRSWRCVPFLSQPYLNTEASQTTWLIQTGGLECDYHHARVGAPIVLDAMVSGDSRDQQHKTSSINFWLWAASLVECRAIRGHTQPAKLRDCSHGTNPRGRKISSNAGDAWCNSDWRSVHQMWPCHSDDWRRKCSKNKVVNRYIGFEVLISYVAVWLDDRFWAKRT